MILRKPHPKAGIAYFMLSKNITEYKALSMTPLSHFIQPSWKPQLEETKTT